MTDNKVFTFTSFPIDFPAAKSLSTTTDGLICTRSCEMIDGKHHLVWTFDWDKLKERRIFGFKGEIVVIGGDICGYEKITPIRLEVCLIGRNKTVQLELSEDVLRKYYVKFKYTFVPVITMGEEYDAMFLPSEKHDAVLEVDAIELHVNKTFLSYHSDFFAALFSSKFKEGQMSVIPIEDVTYEEIGLLFSAFYPKALFPNDRDVPKLLELADRFLLPSVTHHVECHLLNNSKIENEKMTWMADRYGMKLLLEKMINQLDTVVKAKKLKASSDYMQLSEKTKARILDKVMCII